MEDVCFADPPQAENPAEQDSFYSLWTTKIDVKNKGSSEKLCNNTGNAGKPRAKGNNQNLTAILRMERIV